MSDDWGDSAQPRYCAYCGNQLMPGQRYCGACGKDMWGSTAPGAPKSESWLRKAGGKVLAGIGITIGVGFAILGFLQPYFEHENAKTYAEMTATAAAAPDPCEGYREWQGRSNDRTLRVANQISAEATKPSDPDNKHAQSIAIEKTAIAEATQDTPPPAAVEYNELLIQLWSTAIELQQALDNHNYNEVFALNDELEDLGKQVNEAENELTDTCG